MIKDSTYFVNIRAGACDIFIVTKKQPPECIYYVPQSVNKLSHILCLFSKIHLNVNMSQCIKVLRFYKIFQCEHSTIESMRELVILEEIMD